MPELTSHQQRQITESLGYRRLATHDDPRFELIGPEGRHRGLFRPSRATDTWIWNDAAYAFELYRDRDGGVHRRRSSAPDGSVLERVWPDGGEPVHVAPAELERAFERLSSGPSRTTFVATGRSGAGDALGRGAERAPRFD